MAKKFLLLFLIAIVYFFNTTVYAAFDNKESELNKNLYHTIFNKKRNLDKAKRYLLEGADINFKYSYNYRQYDSTILMLVSERKYDYELLSFLISNGSNINIQDKHGRTALFYAAKKGDCKTLEFLLKNGAKNIKDNIGRTALFAASENGNKEAIDFLIQKGFSIHDKDILGETPFSVAITNLLANIINYSEYEDVIDYFLSIGLDVNTKTRFGHTVLFALARRNCPQTFEKAINLGADVNAEDRLGQTALFGCVRESNVKEASILLSKGADVNKKDIFGETPLFWAVFGTEKNRHYDIVKFLINSGADINVTNNVGQTPLYWAAKRDNLKYVEELLNSGVNLECVYSKYSPILDSRYKIAEIILSHTSALVLNSKLDERYNRLFVNAIRNEEVLLCKNLIDKLADLNVLVELEDDRSIYTRKGTILIAALRFSKKHDIIFQIINKGADVNTRDSGRVSPLMYAAMRNSKKLVNFLLQKGAKITNEDIAALEKSRYIKNMQKNGIYDLLKSNIL